MVAIDKIKYEKGYEFNFNLDEGIFTIIFAGNLDLYWDYKSNNILEEKEKKTFLITKENYFLYSLFDKLYESVKNYDFKDSFINENEGWLETFQKDLKIIDECNEERLFKDGVIDYHSDDYPYEEASRFEIEKLEDSYKLTFHKGKTNGDFITYAVRISNSGSRYQYFNILFMEMYHKLIEYNPEYHQIHIEEYLYELKRTRKKEIN